MHELPVTESILDISLRHAAIADANRIISVHLVIGQLASIVDDSVQFYWDILTVGTAAEGAELIFKRIETRLCCTDCNLQYIPTDSEFSCPDCGSHQVEIIAGKEFYVEAIDVESDPS